MATNANSEAQQEEIGKQQQQQLPTAAEYQARAKALGRENRLSFRNLAETQLRRELKEIAMEKCDPQIAEFAKCAKETGLLVVFSCKQLFKNVNECMNEYNGEEAWKKYKAANEEEIRRRANLEV